MKLTKDYFIEGQLLKEGTEISLENTIKEKYETITVEELKNYFDNSILKSFTFLTKNTSIQMTNFNKKSSVSMDRTFIKSMGDIDFQLNVNDIASISEEDKGLVKLILSDTNIVYFNFYM